MEPGDWLTSIYSLFISNKGLKLRVNIPDTIYISEGGIQSWFRTNEHGYVARVSVHGYVARHFFEHLCSRPVLGPFNPAGYMALAHYAGGHSEVLTKDELGSLLEMIHEIGNRPPNALDPEPSRPSFTTFEDGSSVYLPYAVQAYVPSPFDLRFVATFFLENDGGLCNICTRRYSLRHLPRAGHHVLGDEVVPVQGHIIDGDIWGEAGRGGSRDTSPNSPLPLSSVTPRRPPSARSANVRGLGGLGEGGGAEAGLLNLSAEAQAVDLRARADIRRYLQHLVSFVKREHTAIMHRAVVEFVQGAGGLYMLLVQKAEFGNSFLPAEREGMRKLMSPRWASELSERPMSGSARSTRSQIARPAAAGHRPHSAAVPVTTRVQSTRKPLYRAAGSSPCAWGSRVSPGPNPLAAPPASPHPPLAETHEGLRPCSARPAAATPAVPPARPYSALPAESRAPSGDWVPKSAGGGLRAGASQITAQLVEELEVMREELSAKSVALTAVEGELEAEKRAREKEVGALEGQLAATSAELVEVSAVHQAVEARVEGLEREGAMARSQVYEVCLEFDKVKVVLERERQQHAQARADHAAAAADWEDQRARLAREREEAVSETTSLRETVAADLEEIRRLKSELAASQERVSFLEMVVEKVTAERDALRVTEAIHGTSELEWNSKLGFQEDPEIRAMRREMARRAEMVKMAQGARREDGSAAPPLQLNIKDLLLYADTDGMQLLKCQVLLRQHEGDLRNIYSFYCFLGTLAFRREKEGVCEKESAPRLRSTSPVLGESKVPDWRPRRSIASLSSALGDDSGDAPCSPAPAPPGEMPPPGQPSKPYREGLYVKSTAPVTVALSIHQFGRFAVDTGVLNLRDRGGGGRGAVDVAKVFSQVAEESKSGVLECHFLGFLRAICRLAELKYKGAAFLKEVEELKKVMVPGAPEPVGLLEAFRFPRTAALGEDEEFESPLYPLGAGGHAGGRGGGGARGALPAHSLAAGTVAQRVEAFLGQDVLGHARRPKVAGAARDNHKVWGDGIERVQQAINYDLLPTEMVEIAQSMGVPAL